MSLQWALAAGFLYVEMGFLFLLCLPFISSSRWSRIFNSRFLSALLAYSHLYFNVFVVAMLILFLDSVRESVKFGEDDWAKADPTIDPRTSIQFKMRLFRAQRNLYITGFALFLLLKLEILEKSISVLMNSRHVGFSVVRRVVGLHQCLATAMAKSEAAIKQAKGVSNHCEQLMEEIAELKKSKGIEDEKKSAGDVGAMLDKKNKQLAEREEELSKTKKDLEQIKQQAKGVSQEYDRLLNEHGKLQEQIEKKTDDDKKDD